MKKIDPQTPIWKLTVEEFLEIAKSLGLESRYEYGLKGLAKVLGCSVSKASEIKSSGILDEAIIQKGRLSLLISKSIRAFSREVMVYYLELIQRFWEFGPKARLSTTATVVYFYLLKRASDNNGYNVVISDVMLSETLGLTRKTIKPAKEALRNLGLIQYESRKGLSCSYRIILNYPLQVSGQEKFNRKERTSRLQSWEKVRIQLW